ncbi:hypothetical protein EV360DRAFT_69291 [Lentinula raphanica]|nr:hypothetical protein EV360DRAFT_69291 [Lentinula raphanica]
MRPVVINLGLSLLMVSTWAMPVSDHIQTSTTNARETQPAHVYISNLGVIPNAKLFKYVEAGIQWIASQHKDWGFPDKFEVVQTPVADHFDRAYVNREDGSHEFLVRLETHFRILNLRDLLIGWGRIKMGRETSDTEFSMENGKTKEYVTIGDKIKDVMMFEDVDSQVGNIAVVERGKNLVDEETEKPQKKKFWKCCLINPHRREFTRRTTASRLVKLLEHLQTTGHHASTATVHDEFTRFWLLDIKTLKTRIGTVHHATMVRNETFESAAVGILSGFLLTAPRAVLTKRQHAIQFDQPTFPRPESFDGLNLGHASESCHGLPSPEKNPGSHPRAGPSLPISCHNQQLRCVEARIHSAARKEGWGFPEEFKVEMGSEKNNNGREDPPTIIFGVHLEDTDSPTCYAIRRKKFPDYEFTMSSNIKTNAKVTIGKESDSMMFKESGNGVVVVVGRELKKSANENKQKSDKCCVIACFEIADHDSLEKLHRKRWIPETVEALELWDR